MPEQFTEHLNLPLPSAGNPLSEDVGRIAAAFTALDAAVHQGAQGASQIAQNLESLGETVGGLEQGLSNLDNSKMPANRVASSSVLGGVKVGGGLVISEAGALAVSGDAYYDKPQINALIAAGKVLPVAYEQRATLRAIAQIADGSMALVAGLGLFAFAQGSTEPDDDETCFSTATGCWLMQTPSADWLDVMSEQDVAARQLQSRVLCPITSVAANAMASFDVFVPLASVSDATAVNLPASQGANNPLSVAAFVSAANTVTVELSNPAASARNLPVALTSIPWTITVIKGV